MNFIDAIREIFGQYVKHDDFALVVVRKGDTLYGIAEEITGDGENWRQISDLNPGLDAQHTIQPGQELKIPIEWVDEST